VNVDGLTASDGDARWACIIQLLLDADTAEADEDVSALDAQDERTPQ